MGEHEVINNLELHKDENYVVVSVNPKIYPLDVIYSATHFFLEKTFVIIDGDPQQEIIVELKPKADKDIEELGRDFNNELIIHAAGKICPTCETEKEVQIQGPEEVSFETNQDESYINDPLGIARPWEEVYGKGGDK